MHKIACCILQGWKEYIWRKVSGGVQFVEFPLKNWCRCDHLPPGSQEGRRKCLPVAQKSTAGSPEGGGGTPLVNFSREDRLKTE